MKLPEPEKSSTATGVFVVLLVLALAITTLWYREGASGPVHRVREGVLAIAAPVDAAGEFVTRPIRGVISWASDLGVSRSQLDALRKQNGELRNRVATLEEARLENERLRVLVGFVQANKLKAVGARVIGRPTNSYERVLTIDRGSADGIRSGMPVLAAEGVLGQTTDVTAHSAQVRLITDSRSGVAVMVQSNRAEGVAKGSLEGQVTLDFISRETTVRAGDVVVTSGMGGVYPKGLLVGEVTNVTSTPASLYQDIDLSPAANLSGLEEVVVLTGAAPATQTGSVE